MTVKKVLGHILFSSVLLGLTVGLPAAMTFHAFDSHSSADAVSSASLKLPDKPSGEFIVLINNNLHEDTLHQWVSFFRDGELNVIFDDIRCITAQGDTSGTAMAEHFQAQLPENQMYLRSENPTLLFSKAENGCIDVAIFSKEMADAMNLSVSGQNGILTVIDIVGGTDEDEKA